jgi:hypothetical protein
MVKDKWWFNTNFVVTEGAGKIKYKLFLKQKQFAKDEIFPI